MKSGLSFCLFVFGVALGIWATAPLYHAPQALAQELSPEQRAKLQAEYDQLQQEIAQWQKVLDDTRAKKNTLQGDVTTLDAQIKKAQAEINQRNRTVTLLGSEINKKTETIRTLESRLTAGRESLAKLMRQKNESEQQSLAILALSSASLSSFFDESQSIDTINRELQSLFEELRGVKQQTEKEKQELDEKKNAELDARYEIQVKQNEIKEDQNEKKQLLDITKKDEQSYSKVLEERKQRAEQIRAALFELRDAQGITFELALDYAKQAEKSTGVRAAFILGILRQESNLGTNVGKCYLTDPKTGEGRNTSGKVLKNVMKADRDVQPFIEIVTKLGEDPYSTVVSCPQSAGYGGAMGPAQFIGSTWKLYEKRLQTALAVSATDPWSPRHAIMAMGMFLKDLKADRGTYSAEREAAARYYAGGYWQSRGLSYAASVLKFAEQYQKDIDFLAEN